MSKTLLDQQAEKLLTEFLSIIEEKWLLSTKTSSAHLNNIFEEYLKMNEIKSREEDSENEKDDTLINSDRLKNLSQCNQYHENLSNEITNFEKYKSRLEQINKNLSNMLKMESDFFNGVDADNFKNDLDTIVKNYCMEFQLKNCIFKECLFKARLKTESQITLASVWINEPYLDEFLNFKLKSFVKNRLLKK